MLRATGGVHGEEGAAWDCGNREGEGEGVGERAKNGQKIGCGSEKIQDMR